MGELTVLGGMALVALVVRFDDWCAARRSGDMALLTGLIKLERIGVTIMGLVAGADDINARCNCVVIVTQGTVGCRRMTDRAVISCRIVMGCMDELAKTDGGMAAQTLIPRVTC